MSDKYVAYLDILGFKEWLRARDMFDANAYLTDYAAAFREEWEKADASNLNCFLVSDCAVIHTNDLNKKNLEALIKVSVGVSQNLFINTGILIRGAICKGDFEIIEQNTLSNYSENIFTGNAYVDALHLEETSKIAGIALSQQTSRDVNEYIKSFKTIQVNKCEIVRYFTKGFLTREDVLGRFIDKARDADWIPHYHNTIYTALYNKSQDKGLFDVIIKKLEEIDNSGKETCRFIRSAFNDEVEDNYKKQLTTFLRKKIIHSTKN